MSTRKATPIRPHHLAVKAALDEHALALDAILAGSGSRAMQYRAIASYAIHANRYSGGHIRAGLSRLLADRLDRIDQSIKTAGGMQ